MVGINHWLDTTPRINSTSRNYTEIKTMFERGYLYKTSFWIPIRPNSTDINHTPAALGEKNAHIPPFLFVEHLSQLLMDATIRGVDDELRRAWWASLRRTSTKGAELPSSVLLSHQTNMRECHEVSIEILVDGCKVSYERICQTLR